MIGRQYSNKPLYLAEFGVLYSADPNVQAEGIKTIWGHIQEGIDERVLSGGYLMTWQSEDWKGVGSNGNIEKNLGVTNSNGTLKPAYEQMKKIWANKEIGQIITNPIRNTVEARAGPVSGSPVMMFSSFGLTPAMLLTTDSIFGASSSAIIPLISLFFLAGAFLLFALKKFSRSTKEE